MAEGQPDFHFWLLENGLGPFFGGLKKEGFDEVVDIAACSEKDLRELAVILNMKAGHRSKLLRAAAAVPGSRSALVAPKMVVIGKEENDILTELRTMKEQVDQKLSEIEVRTRDVDESAHNCRQQVSKVIEKLANLLDERKVQLISEIDKEAKIKLQGLQAQKTDLEKSAKELENIDKTCSRTLERTDWSAAETRKQHLVGSVKAATEALKKVEKMVIITGLKFVAKTQSVKKEVRQFGSLIGIERIVPCKITMLSVKAKSVELTWTDQNKFCEGFEITLGVSDDEKYQSVDNMKMMDFSFGAEKRRAELPVQPERHYMVKIRPLTAVGWGAYSDEMLFDTPAKIVFPMSSLLDGKSSAKLAEFLGGLKPQSLLYKASLLGFDGSDFHSHCDNKGPTVVVIKRNGSKTLFGGFTPLNWGQSKRDYVRDDQMRSFVFTMSDENGQPAKFQHQQFPEYAIFSHPDYGPTFGAGHTIHICNNSNTITGSYTLGHETYGVRSRNTLCRKYIGFTIDEIEVFSVA